MTNPLDRQAAVQQFLSNQTDEEWLRLRNAILEDMPVRVVITIHGGNYQGAAASGSIDLSVLDFDNWEACDEDHREEAEYYADLAAEVEMLKNNPNATLI